MPKTNSSWRKGRSGNPRGRPKVGEELGALLRQTVDRRRFAEKLCQLCYAGDVQAMRLLLSYTDGPPNASAAIKGAERIQILVNYAKQENRNRTDGATRGAIDDHPTGEALQRRLLRSPLGQDGTRDESIN